MSTTFDIDVDKNFQQRFECFLQILVFLCVERLDLRDIVFPQSGQVMGVDRFC